MKKRNLMFATAVSACFVMGVFNETTSLSANAVQFNIASGETKDITAGIYTDPVKGNFGGIIINAGTLNILEGAEFVGNKAVYGGVIDNQAKLEITKAIFRDNTAEMSNRGTGAMGGVIYGRANNSIITINSSKFLNNSTAKGGGGSIYISKDSFMTINGTSEFKNNTAVAEGGAIYNNNGTFNINGALFEKNKSDKVGGAIYSDANNKESIIKNSTFKNNFAKENGGAVTLAQHGGTLTIDKSYFKGNNSDIQGGAIGTFAPKAEINIGTAILNITNSQFEENFAKDSGGAIASYDKLYINNTEFNNNYTTDKPDANGGGGGAIFLGSRSQTLLDNVIFDGNKSVGNGGAIATRINGDNTAAKLDILNSTFKNNTAKGNGGAIDNNFFKSSDGDGVKIVNTIFKNNSAQNGGAIYNAAEASIKIGDNVSFIENSANNGGAIYNAGTITIGNNAIFKDNKVFEYSPDGHGNDIFNANGTISIGDNAYFGRKEIPDYHDCGIYSPNGGNITIGNNATFENIREAIVTSGATTLNIGDNAHFNGNLYGIDLWTAGDTTIGKNAVFENGIARAITIENYFTNTLTIDDGVVVKNNHNIYENPNTSFGIIYNGTGSTIHFLGSAEFSNNSTPNDNAGVFQNWNKLIFDGDTKFINNYAGGDAGALRNRGENSDTVFNSTVEFISNKADGNGGAILNQGKVTFNSDSTFNGNSAGKSGGAIYTETELALKDANFTNNTAGDKGGAIFAMSDLSVSAVTKDVVFAGNKASDGGDIFMNKTSSTLTLNADDRKSITIASGVSGEKYNMAINTNSTNTGTVIVNSAIKNATVNVDNGTFHLAQGSKLENSTLTMASGTVLNTINNEVNTFGSNITLPANAVLAVDLNIATGIADRYENIQNVEITDINPIGNTTANTISINLAEAMGINPSQMTISEALLNETKTFLTPIRYLKGGVLENGIMSFAPAGNSYKDFNPSVMASPVAAQLGGYLTQLNSYDEAFRNMDMYMLMTKKQRQAMKLRNKYAAADNQLTFSPPPESPYTSTAGWFRPYATFENVHLKGGPRVSNVAYGSFFGAESEMYDLGHGWDGMWGAYVGYNGSHQAFNGISMYQNGGTLGAVGMAYKGNFFTGLTVNAGANGVEASTMYGTDNFSMLMAGIASKTGYNIELADGKFIIQPNFMMSYSFVNTFDYTNAAGVKMHSSPLNAIQIEPGLKFIGNLKNGWQPYLGVSMVWNIMDKTQFNANDVSLPDLSIKPFVRYGIGIRKTWGERMTGFFQCYFTNGGRNGVGLQTGFRWAIGKAPNSTKKQSYTTQLKKTEIKLGCNK